MIISQLIRYVRSKLGDPLKEVLKDPEILLHILGRIAFYRSMMIEAGKPVATELQTFVPSSVSGTLADEFNHTDQRLPDYVRYRPNDLSEFELMVIADDIDILERCRESGEKAILFY